MKRGEMLETVREKVEGEHLMWAMSAMSRVRRNVASERGSMWLRLNTNMEEYGRPINCCVSKAQTLVKLLDLAHFYISVLAIFSVN